MNAYTQVSLDFICPLFTMPYSIFHALLVLNCLKAQRQQHWFGKVARALNITTSGCISLHCIFFPYGKGLIRVSRVKGKTQNFLSTDILFPVAHHLLFQFTYFLVFLLERAPSNISYSKSFKTAFRTNSKAM